MVWLEGDVSEKAYVTVIVVAGPPVLDQGMELLDMSVGETMTLTCLVTAGSGKATVPLGYGRLRIDL